MDPTRALPFQELHANNEVPPWAGHIASRPISLSFQTTYTNPAHFPHIRRVYNVDRHR
jgi:hypothetical protein